jgi:hypothetical protein
MDKSVDKKESFYEEMERVLDQVLKYKMKILLGGKGSPCA